MDEQTEKPTVERIQIVFAGGIADWVGVQGHDYLSYTLGNHWVSIHLPPTLTVPKRVERYPLTNIRRVCVENIFVVDYEATKIRAQDDELTQEG